MKKRIPVLIVLAAALAVNIYFRCFPIYFPQLKKQARGMVEDRIRQIATQEVYQKFPQYDPLAKDKLAKTRFADYLKQGGQEIDKEVNALYPKLKERFQDDRGQTYMMELDCWHWTRYVENVYYTGHPGDQVINGRQFDNLMLAPEGMYLHWDNFLFYFTAFLYKIFSFFKDTSILKFCFYLPLLFAAVFVAVLFFFAFYHGRYIGAVIACLMVGLSPNFIPRSCAGWFDKDILSLLFPVLVVWAYMRAYAAETLKQRLPWICFSAFWVGLFCFTWQAWWYAPLILVIYEALSLCVLFFVHRRYKKDNPVLLKQHLHSLLAFVGFSFLWIILFCGMEPVESVYNQMKDAIFLSNPVEASVWPNVYATVGELKKMNLPEIVNSAGGILIFVPAVFAMLFILTRNLFYRKDPGFKRESSIILTIWFVSMFYACFQGARFIVFLSIPLSIALGWGVNDIYEYLKSKQRVWAGVLIGAIAVGTIGYTSLDRANQISRSIYPLMNTPWYKVLNLLKTTTPADTIINSWWDFGDWFKVVARRRVIFDGQSQNMPQAYWMAKAMLTGNERESLGILRMLNNADNKAFEIIDEYLKDPLRSVLLLESIIPLEPGQARDIMRDFLPASAADKVIMLLFNKPGNAVFVVDDSMLPKISAISYLGNWDFSKVYIVQNFNKKEKDEILDYLVKLGRNPQEMQTLYQEAFLISGKDINAWVSRPLNFYSGISRGKEKDGIVFFDNGFIYNPKERSIYTNAGQVPRSLFVWEGGKMSEYAYTNANVIFSALAYKAGEDYMCILLDRQLANSVFVKLYFLKGQGLQHFKPHIDAQDGNNFLGTYKIEW